MVNIQWLQFGPTICQGDNISEWRSRNVHLLYTCITDYALTKGFNLYTLGHDRSPKPFNALFCHYNSHQNLFVRQTNRQTDRQTDKQTVHYLPALLSNTVDKHGEQRHGTRSWHSVYREDTLVEIPTEKYFMIYAKLLVLGCTLKQYHRPSIWYYHVQSYHFVKECSFYPETEGGKLRGASNFPVAQEGWGLVTIFSKEGSE